MNPHVLFIGLAVVASYASLCFGQSHGLLEQSLEDIAATIEKVPPELVNETHIAHIVAIKEDVGALRRAVSGKKLPARKATYAISLAADSATLSLLFARAANKQASDTSLLVDVAEDLHARTAYASENADDPFIVFLLPAPAPDKHSTNLDAAVERLRKSIIGLQPHLQLIRHDREEAGKTLTAAMRHVDEVAEASGRTRGSEDYIASLNIDSHVLEQAPIQEGLPIPIKGVLCRNALRDIEVKAAATRKTGGRHLRSLSTVAATRDVDGNEQQGYTVWYVPRALVDDDRYQARFRKFSSPTNRQDIVPGNYYMWAEKEKREKGEVVPIADDGNGQCEVDLRVSSNSN